MAEEITRYGRDLIEIIGLIGGVSITAAIVSYVITTLNSQANITATDYIEQNKATINATVAMVLIAVLAGAGFGIVFYIMRKIQEIRGK